MTPLVWLGRKTSAQTNNPSFWWQLQITSIGSLSIRALYLISETSQLITYNQKHNDATNQRAQWRLSVNISKPQTGPRLVCVLSWWKATIRVSSRWFFAHCRFRNGPAHDQTYNNTCVTSKVSDQHVHPLSMARALVYSSLDSQEAVESAYDQRKLIRLRGCAGWSESSLVAQALL